MGMSAYLSTARALVSPGKGILAADESLPTIGKRFAALNIESTEESRRSYREMLFTAPGIEEFVSGVILFDETIRQKAGSQRSFVEVLTGRDIIPGIKVDKGVVALPGFPNEKMTTGRDGLRERLKEYAGLGARFTKWRAVIGIGAESPSQACIHVNAQDLALFAALSQEADLTPVVEPEVLMDGSHDLETCERVSAAVLTAVFNALRKHRVVLEGMLLKTNMIVSGKQSPGQASASEVADATIRVLRRTVPPALPGIVFLSGGQAPEQATEHLNIMNARGPHPWELSFSYARALQDPAIKTWKGSAMNVRAAQRQLYYRAKFNSAARHGSYSVQMEELAA